MGKGQWNKGRRGRMGRRDEGQGNADKTIGNGKARGAGQGQGKRGGGRGARREERTEGLGEWEGASLCSIQAFFKTHQAPRWYV